jgi:oxygen-independent coproporphyrinogen-3 oxidase
VRWKNAADVEDYIERVVSGANLVVERRALSGEERLEEALFTALRLADGVDVPLVESTYGVDVWRRYGDSLQPFLDEGLLIYDGRRLRLTRAGMLLAHEVMAVFVGIHDRVDPGEH